MALAILIFSEGFGSNLLVCSMDYDRPMKPFFIEDKFWGIWGIF
jgi:hypothetical protein